LNNILAKIFRNKTNPRKIIISFSISSMTTNSSHNSSRPNHQL
jgi:hypothetical protein